MVKFDTGIDGDDFNTHRIPEVGTKEGEEELVDHFMTITTYWILSFVISFILFLVFCCKSLSNYIAIRDLKQHHIVKNNSSSPDSNKKRN